MNGKNDVKLSVKSQEPDHFSELARALIARNGRPELNQSEDERREQFVANFERLSKEHRRVLLLSMRDSYRMFAYSDARDFVSQLEAICEDLARSTSKGGDFA
jgi:hypothetical protein